MERYATSSRKELFDAFDGTGDLPLAELEQFEALDKVVKSELAIPLGENATNMASLQKKKKKKKRGPAASQEEPTFEFRLVSGSLVPQSISLQERNVAHVYSNQPTHEDTPEEEEQRRLRVSQIAVDANWLSREASMSWLSPKLHKQPRSVKVDVTSERMPTLFLAERRLRPSKPDERRPVGAKSMVPVMSIH